MRDNELNVLHLFNLSIGEGQTPFETIFSGEEKAFLDKKKKESWFTTPTENWEFWYKISLLSQKPHYKLQLGE